MKILVIDNYDSFTYNIVDYYRKTDHEVHVFRNDDLTIHDIEQLSPRIIVISPGPKDPKSAGITLSAIVHFAGKIPIFGVCLGCQSIAMAFGGTITRAGAMFHGKVSRITHNGKGVFASLPSPLVQTRYHSLVLDKNTVPSELEITATSEDGEIMGVRHTQYPIEGVQFHPESVASEMGTRILENALQMCNVTPKPNVNVHISKYLNTLVARKNLTVDEAEHMMDAMGAGTLASELIASLLTALRMKGEAPEEIAGIAMSAKHHAVPLPYCGPRGHLVDVVGTGGDESGTFNISTAAGIVAASAGAKVAKHGNRAVSSQCGSADVLEALGVNITASPKVTATMVKDAGMGFMFAPLYHPAMKHVANVRKNLKMRTVFNMLGPLINPASVPNIVLGAYDSSLLDVMADVLILLGISRALVLSSDSGVDEIMLTEPTHMIEITNGTKQSSTLDPAIYGFDKKTVDKTALQGGDAEYNARLIRDIIEGTNTSSARDIVVLNAGAVLYIASIAKSIDDGIQRARDAIEHKAALSVLDAMCSISHS